MTSQFRQLLKGTSLMSIAGILQKGVGFFLLPVYTRYLTPADYGAVELFLVLILMVDIIASQGMPSALMKRIAYDKAGAKGADPAGEVGIAIGTTLLYVLACSFAVAVLMLLFADPLSRLAFDRPGGAHLIILGGLHIIFTGVYKVLTVPFRADQKYVTVTAIAFGVFLAQLAGNLLSLLVFDAGFRSLIYGQLCGSLVGAGAAVWLTRGRVSWTFDRAELRILTRFGRPLIFSAIGFMLLSSTDRVLLRYMRSEADVGLYSMAAKLGSAAQMLLLGPFMRTWVTVYYKIAKQPGAKEVFAKFAVRFFGLAMVGSLAAHFFAPYALRILTTPEFYTATSAVGLIVLGRFLFALNDILKVGMNIESRTHLLPVRVVLAGILNIAVGYLLIPSYGITGAALATVIAFLFMDGFTIWACRSFYRVRYDWGRTSKLTVAGGIALLAHAALAGRGLALDLCIEVGLLAALTFATMRILDVNIRSLRSA